MTAYPTRAQLYQFGINSAALSNVPTADQDAALESTSRLADTYCRPRHETPFASPYPLEIVRAVCAIAAWDLLSVRGYNPDLGDTLSARAERAIQWLRDLGAGRAHLDTSADATPSVQECAPLISSDDPVDWFA
jgi:phage gp36-like protein